MSKHGKFINKHLMNQKLEMFIHLDSEWLSYQDGDAQSYTVLVATPRAYDEESGILTLEGTAGHIFYITEGCIEMFWPYNSGFSLNENSTSTIRPNSLKNKTKKRDIM